MKKIDLEIKDDDQLISFLYLKDELMQVYDALRFSNNVDSKAFFKLKNRLESLNKIIYSYIRRSENYFSIICIDNKLIEPKEQSELKTNITGIKLNTSKIIFVGSIPSAGYLQLSYEQKNDTASILVKNNIEKNSLISDTCGYHYNDPMTIRSFYPGIYEIEKGTIIGTGKSNDKMLVKSIKDSCRII